MSSRYSRAHRRDGFTLIELLIVVVIISILAAIAIPKFSSTKGKAFAASMRSDLRNLAAAQEAYLYDNPTYAANVAQLNVNPSSGVNLSITAAGPMGWSAMAQHAQADPIRCYIYVGNEATTAGQPEGVVSCS